MNTSPTFGANIHAILTENAAVLGQIDEGGIASVLAASPHQSDENRSGAFRAIRWFAVRAKRAPGRLTRPRWAVSMRISNDL